MKKIFLVSLVLSLSAWAQKPSLKGSRASVARMARQAELHDFTRLANGNRVEDFVKAGLLVEMRGNRNFDVDRQVSYPFVRPVVKTFVERLSAQSRAACPAGLTVTSLTRPLDEQPRNASSRSVHPTGMAIDFHVPDQRRCVAWLEKTLLGLEGRKVLEATRERRPPHYHVAVFPNSYSKYVSGRVKGSSKAKKP